MGLSSHLRLTVRARSPDRQQHGREESCPCQRSFIIMSWPQCTWCTDPDVEAVRRQGGTLPEGGIFTRGLFITMIACTMMREQFFSGRRIHGIS